MYKKQAFYKTTRIVFILFSLFILMSTSTAVAASVTFRWDPVVPRPDSYRLYAREAGQAFNYNSYDWSGSTTTCTINNLDDQTGHYFVVRARDNGLESANSNQVYLAPAASGSSSGDSAPPSWNGATNGIGLVEDNGTGGRVTVQFDTARDGVDRTNLKFNVYYAASGSWNNTDWTRNNVVADAGVGSGSTFTHAVSLSGLTNGVSYTFGVRAEDQSGNEDGNTHTLRATPTVRQTSSTYNLMLSQRQNRSDAVYLDDAAVASNIYVFVEPTTNIRSVEFLIDGVLRRTENVAPFDLSGGSLTSANPFNSNGLSNGYHTFSARITKTNGSRETISAEAYVGASSTTSTSTASSSTTYRLISTYQNRSNPNPLDGATVSNNIYVSVEPATNIQSVEFLIDGVLRRTENVAPFDLSGGSAAIANPFNTNGLSNGYHTFSARVTKTNGSLETISAEAYVGASSSTSTSITSSSATYRLISTYQNRSNPNPLDGATVSNNIYVSVEPATNIQSVEFLIDGVLRRTENVAPFDLSGGSAAIANPFNTNGLSNGYHTFSARVKKANNIIEIISARVLFKN